MSTMLPPSFHPLEAPQALAPSQRGASPPALAELELEQPKVLIKGDIRLCVTESEAGLHRITGHYCIETAGMREPMHTLWYAEGEVLSRQAKSTGVAFDVRGARAGVVRTYLVAVQAVESGVRGRVVLSGVFVQVVVTGDEPGETRSGRARGTAVLP